MRTLIRHLSAGTTAIIKQPGDRDSKWAVAPANAHGIPGTDAGWFARLFRRRQPSTFHRCLAVHVHFASGGR